MKKAAFLAIAIYFANASPTASATKLDCADPDVQRLVVWVQLSDVMTNVSLNPFAEMIVGFGMIFGLDLQAFKIPSSQVDGVLERECQEKEESESERKFCSVVKSVKIGFIRTTEIHPRTGNLECAAVFITADGKRGNVVKYSVDATAEGGFFVTVETD